MSNKQELIKNMNHIHTTILGEKRIKKNLSLNDIDVVKFCKKKILEKNSIIYRKGKNYYIENNNCRITINAHSYTIITAHLLKKE